MTGHIEIELELEPDDGRPRATARRAPATAAPVPERPARWRDRRSARALAAVGVVAAIATAAVASGNDRSTTGTTAPDLTTPVSRTPTVPATTAVAGTGPAVSAATTPATVVEDTGDGPFRVLDSEASAQVDLGRPMLAGPTGLRLVARLDDGRVVLLDVDGGRATFVARTKVPIDGQPLLAAGPGWTVLRPSGRGVGHLLADDGQVTTLDGLLAGPIAGVYPSDRPDQLWVVLDGLKPTTGYVQLVDLAGATQGSSLPLNGVRPIGPDGAGGVLVATTGGVYRADRNGFALLTAGVVLATSQTHVAVLECDAALACERILVERATGARTPLGPAPPGPLMPTLGAVAPGARLVAIRTANAAGITVLDVAGGDPIEIDASPRALTAAEAGPVAWSADGRYLVYLDRHTDHLVAFDTATSTATDLAPGMPPVAAWVDRSR